MNFLLQEYKIDLGHTLVENIFLTDYMPYADGTYVKVYLMGYKYATDKEQNDRFNNETISKNLKIPLSDVLGAWDYWEKQGIIKKHETEDEYNYMIEFINLKQLYVDKIYIKLPKKIEDNNTYVSNNELIQSNKKDALRKMQQDIEQVFGEPQSIQNKRKILKWQKQYNMSPEMMVHAFSYCVKSKKIRRYSYIEKIISLWHNENINDIDSLSVFLEKQEDRYMIYDRISKSLGFYNRALTEGERKTIDKWVENFGFSLDMILKCLDNSTRITNPNINYFDAILESWNKKGYKNIEDLKKDVKPKTQQVKNQNNKSTNSKKGKEKSNKFHNFSQRTDDYTPEELKEIGKKNFKRKLKELGLSIESEGNS